MADPFQDKQKIVRNFVRLFLMIMVGIWSYKKHPRTQVDLFLCKISITDT